MTTIQDTANKFMSLGIATIPVGYRDKKPSVQWSCFRGGIPGSRLPTSTETNVWFSSFSNIGVCCGWLNLHVIDFDSFNEYGRWLRWCETLGGNQARFVAHTAYKVRTRRGVHVYIRVLNSVKHIAIQGRFDVQGNGRFVVGAGSIHPSGSEYVVLHESLFPMVQNISDVLPAAALVESTPVANIRPVPFHSPDPWVEAMQAGEPSTGLVERIKKSWTIEQFFTDTVRTGPNYLMTWCPFHDDDGTRSMWLDTSRQICGCFAGCTAKPLDTIRLFGRLHGLDNRNAIFEMARRS
jgi:hypothetical protein